MARTLRILSLKIRTSQGWQAGYDLDAQVVAIAGPADTGKSSMLDSIAFALGAEIPRWRGDVDRYLREVQLEIRLANRTYKFRRARKTSSHVEVRDEVGDLEGRFSVKRRAGVSTLSEWFLEKLGLDRAFAATGGRLDFHNAILPYCFLSQGDIDRHIILPESQDSMRLASLQLMLGLSDPDYEAQLTTLKNIDSQLKTREQKARIIDQFLSGALITTPSAVKSELLDLTRREAETEGRLATLRAQANAGIADADRWQHRLRTAHKAMAAAETQLDAARRSHDAVTGRLSDLEDALAALSLLEDADPADRQTLELVVERTCPECEANLLEEVPPPGRCRLCGRPLRGHRQLQTRIQLQAQRQDALRELPDTENDHTAALEATDGARAALTELIQAHHAHSESIVAPHVDAIASAASDLAAIRQRISDLRDVAAAIQRLARERADIDELRDRQRERREALTSQGIGAYRPEYVVESLNDIFRAIIANMNIPNYTGIAHIDPADLLPYVDGQPFGSRGGGARAAVSVAYSLALLQFTLEDEQSAIPGILVIDSPKKNLGTNPSDQGLAKRVYERFLAAMQIRGTIGDGRFERPFQLIVADNDRPKIPGVQIVHQFAYGDGFIKNLDQHGQARPQQEAIL